MAPQVGVALITAVSALIIAVLTALFQYRRERALRKLESEREREQSIRSSFVRGCQSIQRFRDVLAILEGSSGAMLSIVAQEKLHAARENVASSYEECFTLLDPADRRLLHTAKNGVFEACSILDRSDAFRSEMLNLNSELRQGIWRSRADLEEVQQLLLLSSVNPSLARRHQ